MRKILFTIFFMVVFSGCQGSQRSAEQLKSVEQLEQEVLNAACDAAIKEDYRQEIQQQRGRLSQDQLKRSLENMKRNIRCG